MNPKPALPVLLPLALISCNKDKSSSSLPEKPNIVIIYVDDLGYGDVGCYGAKGVQTPNIDKLAANGMRFTDGHCTAATSTPSRYSLLTGAYGFRANASILPGDAPALIRPGTETIASLLKKGGYSTAVIGKWHLGLGDGNLNWNDSIKPGPHEIGFDYSFLIPATGDRVPCVYVEDYKVVGLNPNDPITISYDSQVSDWPTGLSNPELLRQPADTQHSGTIVNRISRIGSMTGGKEALWKDEDFPNILSEKAMNWMERNKDNPFFLFFSFHDIHVPRVVNETFVGASTMGPRGDAIAQMDWVTGRLVDKIEELGLSRNTLIIFSSDNGPVLNDGYADEAVEKLGDHNPSGPFRGGKYSIFEAGTRVPTITYWPGVIEPGESDAIVSQVDLVASLSSLAGVELPANAAPDSYSMMDTWLGKSNKGRKYLLEQGASYALRMNQWKYIRKSKTKQVLESNKKIEMGKDTVPQLYNLSIDADEQINLFQHFTDTLAHMNDMLQKIMSQGYSRDGYVK